MFYLVYQLFLNSDFYEIYVRSYLSASIDTNLACGGFHEALWLMKRDSLLLGCIYRSPSSSTSNNLIDLFTSIGDDKASYRVILGDFSWRRIQ